MDMDELRAFVAVVETGSMMAAARSLRFARATLRRRIDELEARAGVPLLTRSEQGVTPTPAGELLASKARSILRDVGSLIAEVREVSSEEVTGHLQVVCPIGLPPLVLSMAVTAIRLRFPELTAKLTFSDDPLSMLDSADVALFYGPNEPTGAWRSVELARARLQLMATADYLAEHGTPTSLEALKDHPLAVWREPGSEDAGLPLLDGTHAPMAPFLSTTDSFLLHQLGCQGLCMVLTPYSEALDQRDGLPPKEPVLTQLVGRDVVLRLAVPAALSKLPRVRAVFSEMLRAIGQPEFDENGQPAS